MIGCFTFLGVIEQELLMELEDFGGVTRHLYLTMMAFKILGKRCECRFSNS